MRPKTWARGLATVVGLELRQRVRSRRWWVSLVVWFVLIGAFTLLMRVSGTGAASASGAFGNGAASFSPPELWCDTGIVVGEDGTTMDGCELATSDYYGAEDRSDPGRVVFSQTVCAADDDGTVRCRVASWSTLDATNCYDTGSGPVCSRYDPKVGIVPLAPGEAGPPQPDLPECTNTSDGSAVCHLSAAHWGTGTMTDPPRTCTVSYDPDSGDHSASCTWDPVDGWVPSPGPLVFGLVVFFVLGLGLLVTPALTAGSINGDRQAGTLATLQATTLSATQIALGKLVAAWLTMLAFLVAALPWLVTAMVIGGISPVQLLGCCALVMLELAVMCAVGLGWSALFSRTSGSNLLSYGTALLLSVLTVVFTVLLTPLTTRDTQVAVWRLPDEVQARWDAEMEAYFNDPEAVVAPSAPVGECTWVTETRRVAHTETIWWLLIPNPFVMVADAAPAPTIAQTHPEMYRTWGADPLFATREAVAGLAAGPERQVDACGEYGFSIGSAASYTIEPYGTSSPVELDDLSQVRVWPWSLTANLLLGGTFFAVAVRRLRVPYRTLPKGTRVA